MKKPHILWFAVIASVFLLITNSSTSAAAAARWTVMVYMSGDNNLEDYIVKDLESELGAVGSTADIQVVALADRGPGYDRSYGDWQTTKLFHVTKGMTAAPENAVADWGERNMGDPQTLVDFVAWTQANFPAQHYALYFWGHGWNWHPGYVMLDATDNDSLDMDEFKAALPSIGFIDMVGFDGCNMAAIEVQNLWHGHANAFAHAQEYVGWEGIQYDLVLAALNAHPEMAADQLAVVTSQSATADRTWSAVAVDSRFDALLTAVDNWSVALKNGLAANRKKYDRAFGATQDFWQAPMDKDLYDMANEIQRNVTDSTIRSRSQAVMDAVRAVVLDEHHINAYPDAHGITINFVRTAAGKDANWRYYRTIDFALQTRWDEFLDAYAR